MKCPKCQHENPDGAKFCGKCRAKLSLICPHCNLENLPGNIYCNECGNDLIESQPSPAIDYNEPKSYTPKPLADKILTSRKQIEGERKLVTVMFADVANYTSISEKLDPEEVHRIIDGWYRIVMEEVHRYEGTVTQFMGDGVMALFGAPVSHEDHARRACLAGLVIQEWVKDYAKEVKEDHGVDFMMRVGLNSGLVIVSSIGDDLKMDYTAIGDTVNMASRMESASRPGAVLVSEGTYGLVKSYFELESRGEVRVKGKEEPQPTYEVVRTSDVETRLEASMARGLTRFIGRRNEIEQLLQSFNRAKEGSGQVVGIVGEAGVGKSRLLYEFRNLLSPDEYNFLEGSCLHYGGSIIYMPVLDILRSYFEIKEGESEAVVKENLEKKIKGLDEKLSSAIPPLQEILSLKVDDEEFSKLEPKDKRERTFEAIRNLLIRLSQDRPLVLSFEDLHWLDKTSEEFLDFFIGSIANANILMLLLYRPEYTHQWGSRTYYTQIGLDQLKLDECAELVRSILEEGELVPEIRELILSRAAGNPLFMEEMTHTLLENGTIKKEDSRFFLTRPASEIEVPDTVQGIIAARMDRLAENIKRTMQVASVIGRDFAFRILSAITEMKKELKSHLANLQGLEFIYEKSLFPELEYIFKHALTQEVAYNSLLVQRRKEIHEKIGRAIEELYADRLEEFYEMLAYHYSMAENQDKAYQYYKFSGEKAAGNYSNRESVLFYKQAIHALDQMPETQQNKRAQLEVHTLLVQPLIPLGYPEDCLKLLKEGERLSKELEDERSLALFYGRISVYYLINGNPLLGIQYSEEGFNEARKIQDIELMAPVAAALCASLVATGDILKIVDIGKEVIALLEKHQRESDFFSLAYNVYSTLCGLTAASMVALGKFEEGEAYFKKALLNLEKIDDLMTSGLCEYFCSFFYMIKGDGRLCVEHAQNAVKYYEEVKSDFYLGSAWGSLGYGYYLLGDLSAARKYIEKGLKIQSELGVTYGSSLNYCHLSSVHCDSGDMEKARSCAQKALEISRNNNEKSFEGMSIVSMGKIWGKADPSKSDKARETIEQGIKIMEELKLRPFVSHGYLFLGELYADMGKKKKARQTLKKALSMMEEMGMMYWPDRAREVLSRL